MITVAILTLSDKGAADSVKTVAGPLIREMITGIGATVDIMKLFRTKKG